MQGPFHRRESPTQTAEDAELQATSGEVWGRTPRNGITPTVQAYAGAISPNQRGVEFTTPVMPHDGGSPFEMRWYLGITPGVRECLKSAEQFACIFAKVSNLQPRIFGASSD